MLKRFLHGHNKFDPGINAIRSVYDSRDVAELRTKLSQKSLARNLVYAAQLLIATSCNVVKYLSAEYQDEVIYGKLLIGLYVGKMLSWGLGAYLEYNSGKPVLDAINSYRGDSGDEISIATMASAVCDVDDEEVTSIAAAVKTLIDEGEIEITDDEQYRLENLDVLMHEIGCKESIKKCVTCITRVLSLLTGITAGVVTSRTDTQKTAFWMKISSNVMDTLTDHTDTFRTGEVVNRYVAISEIMYLCEYFLSPMVVYEL
ncbi:MAG: hypothetical protein LBD43_02480 [Holosporales bacterium]|nr:hypothetical protein [Holosporales bacterium]